jgi:hypothetical protein
VNRGGPGHQEQFVEQLDSVVEADASRAEAVGDDALQLQAPVAGGARAAGHVARRGAASAGAIRRTGVRASPSAMMTGGRGFRSAGVPAMPRSTSEHWSGRRSRAGACPWGRRGKWPAWGGGEWAALHPRRSGWGSRQEGVLRRRGEGEGRIWNGGRRRRVGALAGALAGRRAPRLRVRTGAAASVRRNWIRLFFFCIQLMAQKEAVDGLDNVGVRTFAITLRAYGLRTSSMKLAICVIA